MTKWTSTRVHVLKDTRELLVKLVSCTYMWYYVLPSLNSHMYPCGFGYDISNCGTGNMSTLVLLCWFNAFHLYALLITHEVFIMFTSYLAVSPPLLPASKTRHSRWLSYCCPLMYIYVACSRNMSYFILL